MADDLPPWDEVAATLKQVSTATLTTVLLKKGLRNVWMRNAQPIHADVTRLVGRAFTLRFVPAREDLGDPGLLGLADLDAGGDRGDARGLRSRSSTPPASPTPASSATSSAPAWRQRGVAALVTDGPVRDLEGVLGTGLPVWCRGAAAPPSVAGLTFVGWQQPIGCGGVAVFPDDVDRGRPRRRGRDPAGAPRPRCSPRRRSRSGWRPGSWPRSPAARSCPGSTR